MDLCDLLFQMLPLFVLSGSSDSPTRFMTRRPAVTSNKQTDKHAEVGRTC